MEGGQLQLNIFSQTSTNAKPTREDIISEIVESVIKQNAYSHENNRTYLKTEEYQSIENTSTSTNQNLFEVPQLKPQIHPILNGSIEGLRDEMVINSLKQNKRKSWYYKFRPEYTDKFPGIQVCKHLSYNFDIFYI